MTGTYKVGRDNKARQLREKANYDKATVHAILDAALVAQVGFVQDGAPVVVPMIFGREDETIYLHGARKARVIRLLEQTDRACVNVTLIDGIVYARSAFYSSMNYRSVTVFGHPRLIAGNIEKLHAMRVISEHIMPGRWDELRDPLEREIKKTGVIALSIGLSIGLAAAYYGGRLDAIIMRVVDLQLSFPAILLALIVLAVLGKGVSVSDSPMFSSD